MRLAAYVRVSTRGQAEEGLGRVDQERKIKAWLKENGHSLCGPIAFDLASGTTPVDQRKGFVDALGRIAAGRCEGLVLLNLGRIARTLTVQEAALALIWSSGGRVFAVGEGEVLQDDPEDPYRTAIRQMFGVFHQLDRAIIVARMKGGRQVKASRGGYAFGAPAFGQRASRDKAIDKALVPEPTEVTTIARMVELRDQGASLRAIATVLDTEGHRPKRGDRWHPQTVARCLARA